MRASPPVLVKLFAGSFKLENDKRFDYMIECRAACGGIVWFACVRHKGEYRGSPNGVLPDFTLDRAALELTVCGLVEAAIRDGLERMR